MDNQRNVVLAVVLSAIILIGWTFVSERLFPVAKHPAQQSATHVVPADAPAVAIHRPILYSPSTLKCVVIRAKIFLAFS